MLKFTVESQLHNAFDGNSTNGLVTFAMTSARWGDGVKARQGSISHGSAKC